MEIGSVTRVFSADDFRSSSARYLHLKASKEDSKSERKAAEFDSDSLSAEGVDATDRGRKIAVA